MTDDHSLTNRHPPGEPPRPSPDRGSLRPLGLDEVAITGGFWADRQRDQRLRHPPAHRHLAERGGWIGNFDARAQRGTGAESRTGREFSDSEVYKFLEAMAWELGRTGDAALEARSDATRAAVAAAQEPDGYLNTPLRPARASSRATRDLEWGHELYCYGHLIQAAVARAAHPPRRRPDRRWPAGPPTTCATCSAPAGIEAYAATR